MRVLHVVGARPNFMKTAPIMAEMARYPKDFHQILIHTGQHYDDNMSRVFFEDLEMPLPDEFLNVGSGTHAEQTAKIMLAFEPTLSKYHPDLVMVVGDVNSTLACALVCAKLGIRIAHVEAGLRSRDRTMPEEINRLLTDGISDLLFTPSKDADENLLREGVATEKIHFVGNVMIDTLVKMLPRTLQRSVVSHLGLETNRYILVTLHRPSNVDNANALKEILAALLELSKDFQVVFPVHPRTQQNMARFGLPRLDSRIQLITPVGYLDFLTLMKSARLVLTDSGGIQEETAYLGIPCLTLRSNTERPVTLEVGTNRLVASNEAEIVNAAQLSLIEMDHPHSVPELWDGRAAERIAKVLLR